MKTTSFNYSNKYLSQYVLLDILEPIVTLPILFFAFSILNHIILHPIELNADFWKLDPFWLNNMWWLIGLDEIFVILYQIPICRNTYIVVGNELCVKEYSFFRKILDIHIPLSAITDVQIIQQKQFSSLRHLWHKQISITIEDKSFTLNTSDYTQELFNYLQTSKQK